MKNKKYINSILDGATNCETAYEQLDSLDKDIAKLKKKSKHGGKKKVKKCQKKIKKLKKDRKKLRKKLKKNKNRSWWQEAIVNSMPSIIELYADLIHRYSHSDQDDD